MPTRSSQTSSPRASDAVKWYQTPAVRIPLKVLRILGKALVTLMLVGIITGSIVGISLMVYLSTSFDPSSEIPDLSTINSSATSTMYVQDENGDWVEFMALDGASHTWVDISDIPVDLQNATVAIEDERFYDHYGVDWKRTISAAANLVLHFRSTEFGASTLTQQLIKNLTGNDAHSVTRKVTEIFGATYMESQYSKEEILEAYLNIIPLTGNITGVAYGAQYYFGKDVSELDLAECAALATITNNPSLYDPYRHPENVRDRQHLVLEKMLECGFITEDEYIQAINEEITYHSSVNYISVQDYYTDMVIESVISDLQSTYGYGYAQAEAMVFYGGLQIYSYEDVETQQKMEALYADESIYPESLVDDDEDPRFAFFAVDYDGKVLVTIGDRGEKTADRVSNISTMSKRQCGSAIKPISVYDLAIEMNLVTYSSRVRNAATITLEDGTLWPPNYNQSAGDYGYTTVNAALRQSLNTVPVALLTEITPERSYNFITNILGISTYVEADINYSSLALGGSTYGMYLSELTAAYEIFGNGGVYNGYYCYDRVTDADGNVLLKTQPKGIQAISSDTAYVMNRLLTEVVYNTNNGTLRTIASDWKSIEMFGKTGTTDSNNDVLAIGGTPYCVGGAWFGYRYNQEMTYTQAQAVKQLFNKGMKLLHEGKAAATFQADETVVEKTFCTVSGLLATDKCTSTAVGYYRASNIPGTCTTHKGSNKTTTTSGTGTTTTISSATTTKTTGPTGGLTVTNTSATEPTATTTTDSATEPTTDTPATEPTISQEDDDAAEG